MKIYDCFTFFNELDVLEIRLNELNDIVDYFVLIEATKTWQNSSKPLYYLDNIQRFEKFSKKIIHVQVPDEVFVNNAWANEEASWNAIGSALNLLANEDDLIMISALDEIPSYQSILSVSKNYSSPVAIDMPLFYYYLNTVFRFSDRNWAGTYITSFKELDVADIYKYIVHNRWNVPAIGNGWHFSFLGDSNTAYEKVHSYSHSEFNHFTKEHYAAQINDLKDPFGRNGEVSYDRSIGVSELPLYIQQNLDKFSKYIRL